MKRSDFISAITDDKDNDSYKEIHLRTKCWLRYSKNKIFSSFVYLTETKNNLIYLMFCFLIVFISLYLKWTDITFKSYTTGQCTGTSQGNNRGDRTTCGSSKVSLPLCWLWCSEDGLVSSRVKEKHELGVDKNLTNHTWTF